MFSAASLLRSAYGGAQRPVASVAPPCPAGVSLAGGPRAAPAAAPSAPPPPRANPSPSRQVAAPCPIPAGEQRLTVYGKRTRESTEHTGACAPYGVSNAATFQGVTRLFLETRDITLRTRDPKAALLLTKLRPTLQSMHPSDMGRAMLALTHVLGMSAARRSALQQWEKFFNSKGLDAEYPLTVMPVLGFIANYVVVKGNCSHVLHCAVSNLRRAAVLNDMWNIDATGENAILAAIKAAKLALPSRARESEAVDIDALLVLMTSLALADDASSARLGAIIASAVNFKMRGVEVYGPRGLRRRDVRLLREGVIYDAVLSKTGFDSLQARPRAAPHLTAECAMLCETFWLKRYLDAVDPAGSMPPDNHLFCPLNKQGQWTSGVPKADDEDAAVKACFEGAGIPTAGLNIEWGRHTGESLHIFKCGLHQDTSDLLGDHANRQSVGRTNYVHTSGQGLNILIVGANKIRSYAGGKVCCG